MDGGGLMSVKPELAFDVCWEVYRGAREVLETKRGISALNWKDTGKFLWRPDFRPRLNEWVADFALAGQAALDGPEQASRMVMFRLFYLGLSPYDTAPPLRPGVAAPRHVPSAEIFSQCGVAIDGIAETELSQAIVWFWSRARRPL